MADWPEIASEPRHTHEPGEARILKVIKNDRLDNFTPRIHIRQDPAGFHDSGVPSVPENK